MSLRSQSILVSIAQGVNLSSLTASIVNEIGLEGDWITDIQAVQQGGNILVTVYYKTEWDKAVLAVSPPPGTMAPTSADIDHASILFSNRIDPNRLQSGSFSFDGTGITTGHYAIENNGYIVRVELPTARTAEGYHSIDINSSGLYYQNSDRIQQSSNIGYTLTATSTPVGEPTLYTTRRGSIKFESLYAPNGQNITSFLASKKIDTNRLICSASAGNYVFFGYFQTLEPQLIGASPYLYSYNHVTHTPRELLFQFREPLDRTYILANTGLFKIYNTYSVTTPINSGNLKIDSDNKIVRLTGTVLTGAGIYDLRIGALKSYDGTLATRDTLYSIQVFDFVGASQDNGGPTSVGNLTNVAISGIHGHTLVFNSGAIFSGITGQWLNTKATGLSGISVTYNSGDNTLIFDAGSTQIDLDLLKRFTFMMA